MSTSRCSQVLLFFFAREQKQWLTRSQTAFSALHISPLKPYMCSSLQSRYLCVHIMDRERPLEAKHRDNTQVVLLQPAQLLSQTDQCLLMAANALHSFDWQKNPPKKHTLSAGQAPESKAHYENIISTSEQIMEV